MGHLNGRLDPDHVFAGIRAGLGAPNAPDVWMLGSRYESAFMAAQLGLPFAYPHFFGIGVEEGPAIAELYRKNFLPSVYLSEPKVNVAVQVLCAETEEEALRIASSRNLGRLYSRTGRGKGIPTVEEALAYSFRADELAFVEQHRRLCVDGDPQQVKEGLEEIAERYQTPDLSIVTSCHAYADRVRSYELLAQACGLGRTEPYWANASIARRYDVIWSPTANGAITGCCSPARRLAPGPPDTPRCCPSRLAGPAWTG